MASITSTRYDSTHSAMHSLQAAEEREFALKKYLVLQEQHDELCDHLGSLRHFANAIYDMDDPSGARVPETKCGIRRPSLPYKTMVPKCNTGSLAPRTTEVPFSDEELEDERQLCNVNESIKRVLTKLLNNETIRDDPYWRTWVQGRLMETEKELRTGRRRRSAPETCCAV